MQVFAKKAELSGSIEVPGSKSHTIRACLFAAMAEGTSFIRNPLEGEDCLSALKAVEAFGARTGRSRGLWIVTAPRGGLKLPEQVIDVGNSGSLLYFMTPIAATLSGWTFITGDASICRRPVDEIIKAIKDLGGDGFCSTPQKKTPPFAVRGAIKAGRVEHEGVLSQQISGLLMAAARLDGKTVIDLKNPKETPFVKMTIDWLASVGIEVKHDAAAMNHFEVEGPQRYTAFDRTIPSDWEAAAFPIVAAVITGSPLTIPDVDTSKSQGDAAIVDVLKEMGANIETDEDEGCLYVNKNRRNSRGINAAPALKGGEFNCASIPDAVPALAVAAYFAEGETALTDIGVVRLKETDRISILNMELTKLGAEVEEGADYLIIRGKGGSGLHGGACESHLDHRIAMALSVMGLALEEGVSVKDAECCAVSFPRFYEKMNACGAGFVCEK